MKDDIDSGHSGADSSVRYLINHNPLVHFLSPGFVLWLTGMLINIHSDHILRNLRQPGQTGYRIPKGTYWKGQHVLQPLCTTDLCFTSATSHNQHSTRELEFAP